MDFSSAWECKVKGDKAEMAGKEKKIQWKQEVPVWFIRENVFGVSLELLYCCCSVTTENCSCYGVSACSWDFGQPHIKCIPSDFYHL